eukprot:6245296-Amphidinium_carterae.1
MSSVVSTAPVTTPRAQHPSSIPLTELPGPAAIRQNNIGGASSPHHAELDFIIIIIIIIIINN